MILELWERLHRVPLIGGWLFRVAIGWIVPYTGTIRPRVLELTPGTAIVEMTDRRSVRNHLRSIHAVALMNLAEACSGLAVLAALPESMRAILTGFEIEFLKKARGTITGTGRFPGALPVLPGSHLVTAELCDTSGAIVARAKATWQVDVKPS